MIFHKKPGLKTWHLLLLFLAATAWRLLFVGIWGPLSSPDSPSYENLAQNLLAGTGYVDTRPFQVMDASRIRTPGYPLFLAGIAALFPGQGLPLILIQQLLGVLVVFFVYRIGERLVDEMTGFQAGMAMAFHPWLAIYGNIMMTETLFMFLFTLATLILVIGIQKQTRGRICLAGALFGLSVLVRPAFLLFPLLLPFGLFLLYKKARPALSAAFFFGASCLVVLLPWISWNHAHKGYTGLTSFSGVNLLTLVQPPASFYQEHDPFQKALQDAYRDGRQEVPAPIPPEVSKRLYLKGVSTPRTYLALKALRKNGYSQSEIDRRFLRIAAKFIFRHPLAYIMTAGKGMLKLWAGYPLEWLGGKFSKRLAQNRSDGDLGIVAAKLFFRIGLGLPLIFFTAFGAWKIFRRASTLTVLLVILASITLACGFFTAPDLRYRVPAEPFIMLIILFGIRKDPGKSAAAPRTEKPGSAAPAS